MRAVLSCLLALAMSTAVVSHAAAQETRVRLSGSASAAVGDGGPSPSVSVSGGFQIAPHAGFELEGLYISGQDFGSGDRMVIQSGELSGALGGIFGRSQIAIFPTPQLSTRGRTVAFLSSVVGDLRVGRLRPYVQAGGGMANVTRRVTINYFPSVPPLLSGIVAIPPLQYVLSENDLAATVGTGLDIQLWNGLWVAADVRYMHLFGDANGVAQDLDITRVGVRASWAF